MNDRLNFRAGVTVSYYKDNGDDAEVQIILHNICIDSGGAAINVHKEFIINSLREAGLSEDEQDSAIDCLSGAYCYNDEYYYIDSVDFIDQCTGLKDKNGNLIYDNDFIKVTNQDKQEIAHIWIDDVNCRWVKFKNEELSWNDFCILDDYDGTMTVEIIGTTHENPELLEQSND